MADINYTPTLEGGQEKSGRKTSWGILLTALVLALVLGLGAADYQSKRLAEAGKSATTQQSDARFDGRGKWGGYL